MHVHPCSSRAVEGCYIDGFEFLSPPICYLCLFLAPSNPCKTATILFPSLPPSLSLSTSTSQSSFLTVLLSDQQQCGSSSEKPRLPLFQTQRNNGISGKNENFGMMLRTATKPPSKPLGDGLANGSG
ncbi:hypothetical protein RJT34_11903 [Clitoria ternatea]|uniref:Uncharacterized protein n=1 Tax=Clitoria ternatea TaxID=43366 RepID=A0AAN9JKW1_CLITE